MTSRSSPQNAVLYNVLQAEVPTGKDAPGKVNVHMLPFSIDYNGPAQVSTFFHVTKHNAMPNALQKDSKFDYFQAHFRGRQVTGSRFEFDQDTIGMVCEPYTSSTPIISVKMIRKAVFDTLLKTRSRQLQDSLSSDHLQYQQQHESTDNSLSFRPINMTDEQNNGIQEELARNSHTQRETIDNYVAKITTITLTEKATNKKIVLMRTNEANKKSMKQRFILDDLSVNSLRNNVIFPLMKDKIINTLYSRHIYQQFMAFLNKYHANHMSQPSGGSSYAVRTSSLIHLKAAQYINSLIIKHKQFEYHRQQQLTNSHNSNSGNDDNAHENDDFSDEDFPPLINIPHKHDFDNSSDVTVLQSHHKNLYYQHNYRNIRLSPETIQKIHIMGQVHYIYLKMRSGEAVSQEQLQFYQTQVMNLEKPVVYKKITQQCVLKNGKHSMKTTSQNISIQYNHNINDNCGQTTQIIKSDNHDEIITKTLEADQLKRLREAFYYTVNDNAVVYYNGNVYIRRLVNKTFYRELQSQFPRIKKGTKIFIKPIKSLIPDSEDMNSGDGNDHDVTIDTNKTGIHIYANSSDLYQKYRTFYYAGDLGAIRKFYQNKRKKHVNSHLQQQDQQQESKPQTLPGNQTRTARKKKDIYSDDLFDEDEQIQKYKVSGENKIKEEQRHKRLTIQPKSKSTPKSIGELTSDYRKHEKSHRMQLFTNYYRQNNRPTRRMHGGRWQLRPNLKISKVFDNITVWNRDDNRYTTDYRHDIFTEYMPLQIALHSFE